jgi:ubiquinone/menaquinone biosynthesis C-methylase UbiE
MHTQSESKRRATWYQRLFASMLASQSKKYPFYYDTRKRALLGSLRGEVLEIGPGTGSNLPYYSSGVRWHGLEPNPAMFPYLQREAERLGLEVQLHEGRGERLDVADDSFDVVVGTLVLCSVTDMQRTLREIRRVLKTGGRYVFIEHVAAPPGSAQRRVQRLIKPVWKTVGDGCRPDRETGAAIEKAGFSRVQLEHFRLSVPVVGPHIAGFAVK